MTEKKGKNESLSHKKEENEEKKPTIAELELSGMISVLEKLEKNEFRNVFVDNKSHKNNVQNS